MESIISFVVGFLSYFVRESIKKAFRDQWEAFFVWRVYPRCEICGTIKNLKLEGSRTMYCFEGDWDDLKNPNRPKLLCSCCAEEHHDYWNDMWSEYYNGLL